jgi:hypothetical protein
MYQYSGPNRWRYKFMYILSQHDASIVVSNISCTDMSKNLTSIQHLYRVECDSMFLVWNVTLSDPLDLSRPQHGNDFRL